MSNHSTTIVLTNRSGLNLNPQDAPFMVLNAFRYTFYNRETVDSTQMIKFLGDRVSDIDPVTKGQIAREIGAEIERNSEFSQRDLQSWMIVQRILTRSLVHTV